MSTVEKTKTPKFEEFFLSLPAKAQKEPATLVLRNSMRLYDDARKLGKNGSYQTAISLHILALEELAKFVSLAFNNPIKKQTNNEHINKHRYLSVFLLRYCFKLCMCDYYNVKVSFRNGKTYVDADKETIKKINLMTSDKTISRIQKIINVPDDKINKKDEELSDTFGDIFTMDGMKDALYLFTLYHSGQLNKLKNSALYLDVRDGKITSNPYEIDESVLNNLRKLTKSIFETVDKVMA